MVVFLLVVAAELVLILLAAGKVPLRYSLRNVTLRWKTTALTALAFTMVIGLLTVMLAFVNGMRRLTEGTGQPGNVLVLADGATDEAFSNLPVGDLSDIERLADVMHDEQDRPLASRETYMIINQPLQNPLPGRPRRRFLQIRGIEDPSIAPRVHGLSLLTGGEWFSDAGVREDGKGATRIEAVLGQGVARELGHDRSPEDRAAAANPDRLEVGDTFPLGQRTGVVSGIMESATSTFNSEIWAKRSLVGPLFGKDNYTTLLVRTRDAAAARKFKTFLQEGYAKGAVQAHVETEYYASLSETTHQFLWAIGFVTVFVALGGVFGVMNTMFAAISQRIKDIGVLRLLGYARWQILVCFLLESLLISLFGGLMGCALGTLADGWTATSVVSSHVGGGKFVVLRLVVDAKILGVGMLLTLMMGVLGGIIPALSAMRLRPLESLR